MATLSIENYGDIIFSGGSGPNGEKQGRNYMSIQTEAAANFFRDISILRENIISNALGMYTFGVMGRLGRVSFKSMKAPKHLLRPRGGMCAWDPVGQIDMVSKEFLVEAFKYQGEQCADPFYQTCFEKIYGTGHDINDLMATPEGAALVGELIMLIYEGLGNSFYDVVNYAGHELITEADENDWYDVNDKEWDNFKKQQNTRMTKGHITMIDLLKKKGLENMNVIIDSSEISDDGTTFIGNAQNLFDRVLAAMSPEMKTASNRSVDFAGNSRLKPVIECSPSIFKAYKKSLIDEYGPAGIPEAMHLKLSGQLSPTIDLANANVSDGVLKYDGHLVVRKNDWENFDKMTGTITHRCTASAPGVYGIGYDVPSLDQFGGLGMRLMQDLDAPANGMIYMDTYFDLGMGIVNENFIVNASKVYRPA